jgi:predicted RecB family nuclease
MKKVISPFLFFEYSICPCWIWHDMYSDPETKGEIPELAQKLMEQGVLHENEYIKGLVFDEVKERDPAKATTQTLGLMRSGSQLIYQGTIETEVDGMIWRGRPDLLQKLPGKSIFGDWFYIPVDIKNSKDIKADHRHQLALYAKILERVQGTMPNVAYIINRNKQKLELIINEDVVSRMFVKLNHIIEIVNGKKPDMHLRRACDSGPWGHKCLEDCVEANDIGLIYNVPVPTLDRLRELGIKTVDQLAKLDPMFPEDGITQKTWQRIIYQAKSLTEDKIIWVKKPNIPDSEHKIYFDIEGDPLLETEYLFGFWLSKEQKYKYFIAEEPNKEENMWYEFLEWLKTLPQDYVVYHYASYEKGRLTMLEKKYGGSNELNIFKGRLVDLFTVVKDSLIFPSYFYSIKNLAKSRFVNYKWRHQKAGGAQSIFWYEKWLESGDRQVLQDIIDYNEDDVIATEYLHSWLEKQKTEIITV